MGLGQRLEKKNTYKVVTSLREMAPQYTVDEVGVTCLEGEVHSGLRVNYGKKAVTLYRCRLQWYYDVNGEVGSLNLSGMTPPAAAAATILGSLDYSRVLEADPPSNANQVMQTVQDQFSAAFPEFAVTRALLDGVHQLVRIKFTPRLEGGLIFLDGAWRAELLVPPFPGQVANRGGLKAYVAGTAEDGVGA